MTDIVIKRGIGKPDNLLEGELAIDTSTGMLYSLVGGVVAELNEPPEGVDLSKYIDSTKRNDVVEGTFQILWDDSADETYPFNGRIGYNRNSEDPNSLDGSFLYASGTRGTFSIGRDGDVELHGPSEIQGIPDRDDARPWITGFSYVQAADFLDPDGNSIVGGGMDIPNEYSYREKLVVGTIKDDALNRGDNHTILGDDVNVDRSNSVAVGWKVTSYGDSTAVGVEALASLYSASLGNNARANAVNALALGYNAQTDNSDSIALGHNALTTAANQFAISPSITEVDFSNATVQASDFLDADGNSIIGQGGGASVHIGAAPPEDPQEGQQWLETPADGDAKMWVYDGAVWLEQPGNGSGGADGLWTDNGDTSISYTAGSVGIGTDTPKGGNSKIDIRNQGNGAGANIHFQNDHNSGFNLGLSGDAEGDVVLWNEPATKIKFATNNTERMRIDADGNVLVNTDNENPTAPSENVEGVSMSSAFGVRSSVSGNTLTLNRVGDFGDVALFRKDGERGGAISVIDGHLAIRGPSASGSEAITIDAGGNVGIGTDTPLYPSTGRTALTVNGDTSANLVFGHSKAPAHYLLSDASGLTIGDDSGANLTIDADGWVNMANEQIDVGIANGNEPTISFKQSGGATKFQFLMNPNNFGFYIWDPVLAQSRMQLDNSGNLYALGNIYKQNGTPVMATSDMVKAFSKLRDAVKDEETVESLKESITNCIGGLIEEWEAMQSTATQEISDE